MMTGPHIVRRTAERSRREILSLSAGLALTSAACTAPMLKQKRKLRNLGERVEAGGLVFNVLETRWSVNLGELPSIRIPKHNFLALRITITNQSGQQASCPSLALINDQEERFGEVDDAKELEGWIGMLRLFAPGGSDFGWILFDVPQANYVLELTDGKLENEQLAFVSIPLRMS